jgi:hypothetical protein
VDGASWADPRKASHVQNPFVIVILFLARPHTLDIDNPSFFAPDIILAYLLYSYKSTRQLGTHTTSVLTAKLRSSPALRILARVAAMAQ